MVRHSLLLLATAFILTGCFGSEKPDEPGAGNAAESVAFPSAAPELPAEDVAIERNDDALEFSYGWPSAAVAIAPFDAWLRGHAEDQFAKWHKLGEEAEAMSQEDGFPYRRYMYSQKWTVAGDTGKALVMKAQGYEYTGGAHGMPFTISMIWDRAAQKRLGTKDVINTGMLEGIAGDAFCKALDAQRAEKRGGNAKSGSTIKEFDTCVAITDGEIIPISKGGEALDTLLVVIGPYTAGPYAEGSYEIELPVDAELMAAVKPEYQGWFAQGAP